MIAAVLKSWKTSSLGAVALLLIALGQIWLPQYEKQLNATAGAFAASGLLVAKDAKNNDGTGA
jgi:hypothetical protein